jgi:DNA-binding IclR family transcriptional regulator
MIDKVKIEKRVYPTPALEKGLDILELFAHEPAGLSKSDVARRLDRSVSEIFRMLLCLEERGYIARSDRDDRFRLTLKTFRMAMEYPPTKRLVSEALPIMHDVAHKIDQSCHLGVLERGQVVIVSQADSPMSSGFYVKSGSVVDLMRAASGHVILAHLPPELRDSAIEDWQHRTGKRAPKDFHEHLSKIRVRGYEQRDSYEIRGVINISYPILDENGYAVAALTVPYLERVGKVISARMVRTVLGEAALKLTEAIGGTVSSHTRFEVN